MELSPTSAGIRRGDEVRIMAGRDKGKSGRVLSVNETDVVSEANRMGLEIRRNII